jgi:outer membrane protein assembly factor BamB
MCDFALGGEHVGSLFNNLWQNHRWATIGAVAGLAAAVIALAGYLILKRPADKPCPEPCTITGSEPQRVIDSTNWPLYGLNRERTRYLDAPRVKPPYSVKWTFKGRRLLEYSPILVRGALYAVNNNGLAFSVKKSTGKARWMREIATRNASAPAYSDGMIYISNLEPGQVIALATRDGKTVWRHPLAGRTESSPVIVGDTVIAGCECGTLYAFDRKTGKPLWETDLGGELKAAPAVSDGVAYIGDYSGTMSAVNVKDGSVKWQSDSQGTGLTAGDFYGTAAVAFGRVYAGSKDGRIYSFNKNTGDVAWSQTIGGEVYAGAVAADTRKTPPSVYFGTYGGSTFYALDARDGSERWTADVGGSVIGAASLIGETVYVANLEKTETDAFNAATGDKLWSFKDGAYNPVISDGQNLYLTGYKTIYALKPTTRAHLAKKAKAAKAKEKRGQKKPGKKG